MKKVFVKLLAVILTLTMLFGSLFTLPISAKSNYDPPVKVGVMSDLHYFPESYTNINSVEYQHDAYCDSKLMGESSAILKATLETIAVRKAQGTYNMNFLLVSGDLTFDGEKAGHLEVAALFKAFEARTGIQIFVVNGNHDVNNYSATKYATANGKKITASENPGLLLTSPETFKTIYSDFGYAQANSIFVPSTGKAGMLSYSVSLPGGYRLIAIDSCKYSADVTGDGKDEKESSMSITPELLTWVLNETKQATKRGEAVIGMTHGSLVEHFDLESVVSKNSMIGDYERISYELADAGMHFVFTGHMHANDTSSIISGNNETIYDIETCGLSNIPNTYREASFSKGLVMGQVSCNLNNVDCDAECKVDVSGVSNKYGIIEKPFRENYASPMLYGGSIEKGIRNDGEGYFNSAFLFRLPPVIKETFPSGLAGFLKEKGINLGDEMTEASPTLKAALSDYNLTPQAFSQFLGAIVKQIDNKYILDTTHTLKLVSAAVARFAHFEIVEGNNATQFGKIALLGLEYNAVGDENPKSNPEIQLAIDALRTQKGADRFIDELIDMVISDLLFNDILPSISLNDLDSLLPAKVMTRLRAVAGNDLTVGGILDKILNSAAKKMNYIPFFNIDNGRDLVKALVYTIGYKYLNAGTRLKMSTAFADIIVSFTNDENPALLG
ncbi:MAG: metallophosphoesterase, partial [Eubacteriales bacterium]